jgi:hypothetical protein
MVQVSLEHIFIPDSDGQSYGYYGKCTLFQVWFKWKLSLKGFYTPLF